MDAAGLSSFNAAKAALHRTLWPASIKFSADRTGTIYSVSFGEMENTGQLQEAGLGVQNDRIGSLEFPAVAAWTPALEQVFTVTAAAGQPDLVAHRFRIVRLVSTPGEAVIRAQCRRLEG